MSGRWIGLLAGLVAGALLILAGWRVFLILIAFAAAGYLAGVYIESHAGLAKRIHEFFDRLFGA